MSFLKNDLVYGHKEEFFFPGTAMKTPSFDYPVVFGFFFSQKLIVSRIMENNHCDTEQ